MTVDKLEQIRQESMAYYGFGPVSMKKVRICSQCGTPASQERKYCIECGYRLPDKTLYDVYLEHHAYCPVCETVLTETMEFCPQCGIKIERKIE